jgi:hypothetical protein
MLRARRTVSDTMKNDVIQVADDFWNIRGSYKIGGVLDVGTHASLVRLASGRFVLLDSYTFSREVRRKIDELTGGGEELEAVLNLHPFHTLHVRWMHENYPNLVHFGTERHHSRFPDLHWAELRTEDEALHHHYSADFDFSVPAGVDFISADENLHFSSVLALHRASRTIHSDDTLVYLKGPALMRVLGVGDSVSFHPTLAKVLERRAGAVADFRHWANTLIEDWGDAENLCAAHTAALLAQDNNGDSIRVRLQKALHKVEKVLAAHESKYG